MARFGLQALAQAVDISLRHTDLAKLFHLAHAKCIGDRDRPPDGAEDNESHGFHALDAALEAVIGGSDGRWRR
ncbi:hypothetical protein PO002_33310 [Cupriavidus necator]|uniref:hypothetical protein n=1 Tax=Cupriavidus necator TaxID=106590 RepID=UPI0039C1E3CD